MGDPLRYCLAALVLLCGWAGLVWGLPRFGIGVAASGALAGAVLIALLWPARGSGGRLETALLGLAALAGGPSGAILAVCSTGTLPAATACVEGFGPRWMALGAMGLVAFLLVVGSDARRRRAAALSSRRRGPGG